MSWKSVKSLGVRSSQGQRHARELDRIKAPFLKRHNADGSTSYKKGGTLHEKSAPPDEPDLGDGYYCLGQTGAGYRIMGSATARGSFKDRGSAGSGSFALAALAFYGGGRGADIESEKSILKATNLDDKDYWIWNTTLYTTRTGKVMKSRFTITTPNVAGTSVPHLHTHRTTPFLAWAGTVFKGGEHVRRIYFTGMNIVGGQHTTFVVADPTEPFGDAEILPAPSIPGQLCDVPTLHVTNLTGGLLMLNRYMRPTYKDSSVNVALCPGLTFSASSNHGQSWGSVSSDGMFTDAASLGFLPIDPNEDSYKPWAWKFNYAVRAAKVTLFPTDPQNSQGIAIGLVPVALFIGGSWKVKYRTKIGRYAGAQITESLTVGEHEDEDAAAFMAASNSMVPFVLNGVQGVLYLNRFKADLNQIPSSRPALMWTDGYTTTMLGTMPFANAFTGGFTGISRSKIVCPMYDGAYSLYELTSDMTWTKRATIVEGVYADPEYWAMPNFSKLTYLRKDNRAVSATPSAPWMTNSRILPPT